MSAITGTPSPSAALFARFFAAFAGAAVRRAKQILRTLKHRRDLAMLAGFDDRMLADIGLTRGDLRDAFSLPVWQDPCPILVSRAGDRRAARHRRAIGRTVSAVPAPSIVPLVNAHTLAPRAQAF